ncbi:UNVERIFIED_CONTAM: hypothetical protein Slati_0880700 [Sesamum latifolium]|uniref:DUF4283 domain-containing protein n=1 Tax=Sesamum latifolium TaxID=2727402 RepID=A0AAW2XUG4_9LAMI
MTTTSTPSPLLHGMTPVMGTASIPIGEPVPTVETCPAPPSAGIFIGKVRLVPTDSFHTVGRIAEGFLNSLRKTLLFVLPTIQNGEIVVRPSLEMIRNGSRRWSSMVVGYFLCKKPYFHHLNDYVKSVWPAVQDVTSTTSGLFFFRFKTVAAMEEVPVWVKLRHLPVEFWTDEGLSTVASGIGRPLYPDAITKACTRLDFARVCIMLDISSKLPKHVVILAPTEEGGEVPCRVDIEYKWLPPKCNACHSLGHRTGDCPSSVQSTKLPISVYVQRKKEKWGILWDQN